MKATLYISSRTTRKSETTSAIRTMRELVESTGADESLLDLHVIDVESDLELAEKENIIAVPCLVISHETERGIFVGDFANQKEAIAKALGLGLKRVQ